MFRGFPKPLTKFIRDMMSRNLQAKGKGGTDYSNKSLNLTPNPKKVGPQSTGGSVTPALTSARDSLSASERHRTIPPPSAEIRPP